MANPLPDGEEALQAFSAPVRAWFQQALGTPTPPQIQGWRSIQRGKHTLILAPTGSGKTLAAFLWGVDQRFRELVGADVLPDAGQASPQPTGADQGAEADRSDRRRARPDRKSKIKNRRPLRLVYISPLKALNNDIHRNLDVPLEGIRKTAAAMGLEFPEIRVALRSGDTPQRERQAMLRRPPDILITTPESLYLLLTSPTAREIFRDVRTVIVDEIHTLVGSKRGVHLALSLERLQHLAGGQIQRIGLSATIEPLEEAARFLGGGNLTPRPVTIVNARYPKALDLQVVSAVDDFRRLPGASIWPALIERVLAMVREHRSTLIFCNSRRLAERTADRLNEALAVEEQREHAVALIEGGVARGLGFMAAGDGTQPRVFRAHHGSMSREARLEMERGGDDFPLNL